MHPIEKNIFHCFSNVNYIGLNEAKVKKESMAYHADKIDSIFFEDLWEFRGDVVEARGFNFAGSVLKDFERIYYTLFVRIGKISKVVARLWVSKKNF